MRCEKSRVDEAQPSHARPPEQHRDMRPDRTQAHDGHRTAGQPLLIGAAKKGNVPRELLLQYLRRLRRINVLRGGGDALAPRRAAMTMTAAPTLFVPSLVAAFVVQTDEREVSG